MARGEFSSEPGRGAQELFDAWPEQKALPALYEYLSRHNIDANVTPHRAIREMVERDSGPHKGAHGEDLAADPLALRALGQKGD